MDKKTDARLGILMLDTRFPRIRGDVGNPGTWPFPVRYGVVPGATPEAIVRADPAPFVEAFIAAGRDLVAEGCTGIATTCGFLALIRPQLAEALGVPVAASALEQAPQVLPLLAPGRQLGILTISAQSLTPAHLRVAGVPEDAPLQGMEGTGFARSILGNLPTLDVAAAEREMTQAALHLARTHPAVGAIILECTNMVPYAPSIAAATGLPVFSIYSYLRWFHEALQPRGFSDGHPRG